MAGNPKRLAPSSADGPTRGLLFHGMPGSRRARVREMARADLIRFLDSYASLLVLLLANFLLLEIVDDARWGAVGSTLLAAAALVVAISDPGDRALRHAAPLDPDRRLRRARAARAADQLGSRSSA